MSSEKSVRYSSTRWHDSAAQQYFSFEDVVLKGLASDGGLFHPESIPDVSSLYLEWKDLSFPELAFQVIRPYMSASEISDEDLRAIIDRSYSVFRHPETTPLISLDASKSLHLLELFHGPTFAFKDVALQFLGNLFEFFLVRRNTSLSTDEPRHHLTVIGATSGDTGSAAIYGLRGKKDVSIFIMFPDGKVSPVQEAQMTTVLDANVHNLSIKGTFDDCQDTVKALFADPEMNKTHHLAAVNSINWARILAQITYYFYAYFQLLKQNPNLKPQDQDSSSPFTESVQFVVPTGNFGDVLAGFYATRMGLPVSRLVIATNENDILHRFWQTGTYSKKYAPPSEAEGGGFIQDGVKAHEEGVKETLSPAMDILVSSNFERLLWKLSFQYEQAIDLAASTSGTNPSSAPSDPATAAQEPPVQRAGRKINAWFSELKKIGSFTVHEPEILDAARKIFNTHRVSDQETSDMIRSCYRGTGVEKKGYVLDPHSAVGVVASLREIETQQRQRQEDSRVERGKIHTVTLATAHPAKFAKAVEVALKDEEGFNFEQEVLPEQFVGLDRKERRVRKVDAGAGLEGIRRIIVEEVKREKERVGTEEKGRSER
jgi:threonine synthase